VQSVLAVASFNGKTANSSFRLLRSLKRPPWLNFQTMAGFEMARKGGLSREVSAENLGAKRGGGLTEWLYGAGLKSGGCSFKFHSDQLTEVVSL